jgi:hypothetical protein
VEITRKPGQGVHDETRILRMKGDMIFIHDFYFIFMIIFSARTDEKGEKLTYALLAVAVRKTSSM